MRALSDWLVLQLKEGAATEIALVCIPRGATGGGARTRADGRSVITISNPEGGSNVWACWRVNYRQGWGGARGILVKNRSAGPDMHGITYHVDLGLWTLSWCCASPLSGGLRAPCIQARPQHHHSIMADSTTDTFATSTAPRLGAKAAALKAHPETAIAGTQDRGRGLGRFSCSTRPALPHISWLHLEKYHTLSVELPPNTACNRPNQRKPRILRGNLGQIQEYRGSSRGPSAPTSSCYLVRTALRNELLVAPILITFPRKFWAVIFVTSVIRRYSHIHHRCFRKWRIKLRIPPEVPPYPPVTRLRAIL